MCNKFIVLRVIPTFFNIFRRYFVQNFRIKDFSICRVRMYFIGTPCLLLYSYVILFSHPFKFFSFPILSSKIEYFFSEDRSFSNILCIYVKIIYMFTLCTAILELNNRKCDVNAKHCPLSF